MASKREEFLVSLRSLDQEDLDGYLRTHSGLPGPRANLELADAFSVVGSEATFRRYAALGPDVAPVDSPDEFLAFCGVLGLAQLIVDGDRTAIDDLRAHATDPRWRIREAVARALQRVGDRDIAFLTETMEDWSHGGPLEQRAAAAALCEPRLLVEVPQAKRVLDLLDAMTATIRTVEDRRSEDFRALRKGLGYCWSVAVAAAPEYGKGLMESWLDDEDPDIRWIMRENLRKNRLVKMDEAWVEYATERLTPTH